MNFGSCLGQCRSRRCDSLARLRGPATKLASRAVSDLSRAVVAKLIVAGLFLIVVVLVVQYLQGVIRSLPATDCVPSQAAAVSGSWAARRR